MTHAALFFTDTGAHWACRWLRRGFRHVELAIRSEQGPWVGIGGKIGNLIEVTPLPADFDPVAFASGLGILGVVLEIEPRKRASPIGLQTCVGIAKAALGIRAPWVITPWQLYRRIV